MDLSKLKVCFLAGTLGQGGAEQQLFYILRALRASGTDLRLLCLGRNEFWEDRIKELGVPIISVGESHGRLRRLFRIMGELRKARPHIVQSQHFYTSFYAAAAARALGIHGIGAMRSNGLHEVLDAGRFGGWLNLHSPRIIAANSRPAIQYAVDQGIPSDRLYYLANVVNTTRFHSTSVGEATPLRLLAVGRLYEQKRFDLFISVLAKLRKDVSNPIEGVIVGSGPEKPKLEAQAAGLGLQPPSLKFMGSIADMAPVYREADIFVLTSGHEGTPNVLLEAMASGLPVVSTRVGGVPDIISEGENGLMREPGDEVGICAALAKLIADPDSRRRMGHRARAFVEENHSLERLPEKLMGLYRLVLSSAGPSARSIGTFALSQPGEHR